MFPSSRDLLRESLKCTADEGKTSDSHWFPHALFLFCMRSTHPGKGYSMGTKAQRDDRG